MFEQKGNVGTKDKFGCQKKNYSAKEKSAAASWADFDDYAACRRSLWLITIEEDRVLRYNCPDFQKCIICEHSLGLEIRLKYVGTPSQRQDFHWDK